MLQRLPWQDPCAVFDHLAGRPWAVLLDSQHAGRWSMAYWQPLATSVLQHDQWQHLGWPGVDADAFDVMAALKVFGDAKSSPAVVSEIPFVSGVLASLSYDCPSEHTLPKGRSSDWPQATLAYFQRGIAWDHEQHCCYAWAPDANGIAECQALLQRPSCVASEFQLKQAFHAHTTPMRYAQDIAGIHEWIRAGDCYQVNYAQCFSAPCEGSLWARYRGLRDIAKAPYGGFWQLPWGELVSLSPEQFLRIDQGQITTRPIKGTRARGASVSDDEAEAASLLQSSKDHAENIMITDLLRNDLSKHARIGSVQVPALCELESFGQVHHLVTTITAELSEKAEVQDVLRDAFPGGSITGAPKKRVMEIIDALEVTPRGPYCGSWIYWDSRGHVDSNISIRCIAQQDGEVRLWAGGGITLDSRWQDEYQECLNKMGGVMRLLEHSLASPKK